MKVSKYNDIIFIFGCTIPLKRQSFPCTRCCVEWESRSRWFTSGFLLTAFATHLWLFF